MLRPLLEAKAEASFFGHIRLISRPGAGAKPGYSEAMPGQVWAMSENVKKGN